MIYLDANVFLHALVNKPEYPKAKESMSILGKVVRNEIVASTSLLTWDEVFWVLKKNIGHELAAKEARKFLQFPNLALIKIDDVVINIAQNFTETYRLKPRDAIHAATAVSQGIGQIISDDADFDVMKELKRVPIGKFR